MLSHAIGITLVFRREGTAHRRFGLIGMLLCPLVVTPQEVGHRAVSELGQQAVAHRGPPVTCTVHDHIIGRAELVVTADQLGQGNVLRSRDRTELPFTWVVHIEHRHRFLSSPAFELLDGQPLTRCHQVREFGEQLFGVFDIADDLIKSDPAEAHRGLTARRDGVMITVDSCSPSTIPAVSA